MFEVPRDENGSLEIAIPRYIESIVISMYRVCTVLYIYVIYVCVYNMYLYIYIYIYTYVYVTLDTQYHNNI